MTIEVNPDRLRHVQNLPLLHGGHNAPTDGDPTQMCVMEAVAYVAGEAWSASPQCASPVIAAFCRRWNDGLPSDEDRTRLLGPLIPRLVGTAASPEVEERRAWMATDWLVRECAPAWLRLAGLTGHAEALEGLAAVMDTDSAIAASEATAGAARAAGAAGAAWAAAGAARAAEEKWQFARLVKWLSDNEPEDWPLPAVQTIEEAAQ